jgi:hypothetical protein
MKHYLIILSVLLLSFASYSQDCPFGLVNDTYPGDCSRYTDTNYDKICDLSQASLQDEPAVLPLVPKTTNQTIELKTEAPKTNKEKYDLVPLSAVLVVFYILTYGLAKFKKIGLIVHRRIWNIALLISFLISALLGVLLVIRINTGYSISLPFDSLFWHVEAGIAMFVIAVFHIFWHWQYFKNILKPTRKN